MAYRNVVASSVHIRPFYCVWRRSLIVLPFSLARVVGQANQDRGWSIAYGMVVVLQLTCLVFSRSRSRSGMGYRLSCVLGW